MNPPNGPQPDSASAGSAPSAEGSPAEGHPTYHDSLSNLRHSLRTPLNQIIGYAELLQDEFQEAGCLELLSDLQKIHTAGRQLLELVNTALGPLKVESGTIDWASLFHDMRTPLNLIIGYSELLQEQGAKNLSETLLLDLQRVDTAARKLLSLLESGSLPKLAPPTQTARLLPSPPHPGQLADGGATRRWTANFADSAILVVDDDDLNRDMLSRRLEREGFEVHVARSGVEALDLLRRHRFDLVLLDIIMPDMDGVQTLDCIKKDDMIREVPVIMLSALDQVDNVARCLEIGAEDYLPKPFDTVVFRARVSASLERKRLRDKERAFLEQLQMAQEKSEQLLLNVLPKTIADRLKQGESLIADSFPDATVLFADLVDFTRISASISPPELVQLLNEIFSAFDWLAELHRLEKIKTIGDSYMVVAGLPSPRPDHASAMAEMALEMRKVIKSYRPSAGTAFQVRIGMCTGPVVAGIIGRKKFIYDLWGDTVNLASRMESQGAPDAIQVSPSTYERLKDRYIFEKRGSVEIKGKGPMPTYFLTGRVPR